MVLIDSYISWLQRYIKQEENSQIKQIATQLIHHLQHVATAHQLSQILTSSLKEQNLQPAPKLFAQIQEWTVYVNKLIEGEEKLSANFPKLQFKEKIKPLHDLLLEIFADTGFLFYSRSQSLLTYLDSSSLQATLDYLADIPATETSCYATVGTFKRERPLNANHATCLKLLEDNAKNYDHYNGMQVLANDLLQTALILYREMHTPTPVRDKPQEISCVIF
ncbi:hypothetical protein [Legionella cardiaca]|uniref:Uncharacterized protein n=1 Tax=Legionella cardiaca TaxID=1071983 RepID=A0ABY8ATR6_9GAMM|nr:hypothetical protein [Legionella cardiaca]WED42537.1 hypothetical protein PXX05_11545 [Legionella cardiaca]